MPLDDYKRAIEKQNDCVRYNLSQVDTDMESFVKSQRKDRAKKKTFSDDEIEEISTNKKPSKIYNFFDYFLNRCNFKIILIFIVLYCWIRQMC